MKFVDLVCHGPNRIFGIAGKGRIAAGYDADLTIVDLKRRETITHAWSASRVGWTPFDGYEACGWPIATIIRGRTIMRDGAILSAAAGRPMRFHETI
jgi:dihydroorotase